MLNSLYFAMKEHIELQCYEDGICIVKEGTKVPEYDITGELAKKLASAPDHTNGTEMLKYNLWLGMIV